MKPSSFRHWALLSLVLFAAGEGSASPRPLPIRLRPNAHFMQMSVAPKLGSSGRERERSDQRDRHRHDRFAFPALAGAWDYPFPNPAPPALEPEAVVPDTADAWRNPPKDRAEGPVLAWTGGGAPRILLVGHSARPRHPLPIVLYGATPVGGPP